MSKVKGASGAVASQDDLFHGPFLTGSPARFNSKIQLQISRRRGRKGAATASITARFTHLPVHFLTGVTDGHFSYNRRMRSLFFFGRGPRPNLLSIWLLTLLTMVTAVTTLAGCQNRLDDRNREQKIQEAGNLIDQGNYDRAIDVLTEVVATSPSNDARMYLASAYAGRAGVRTPDYFEIAQRYKQIVIEEAEEDIETASAIEVGTIPDAAPAWVRVFTPKYNENVLSFNRTRRRLSALPLLNSSGRQDMESARQVLTEVTTEGGHLYRAVLGIILLRTYFENANRLSILVKQDKMGICSTSVGKVIHSIVVTYDFTQDIVSDLAAAFPSKTEDAVRMRAETAIDAKTEETMRGLASANGRNICDQIPRLMVGK